MSDPTGTITARTRIAGIHRWPSAPERREYLRSPHRHMFGIEVELAVGHVHREVEFHDLAELIGNVMRVEWPLYHPESSLLDFDTCSCEYLAGWLADILAERGYTVVRVRVSEDGENDSTWRAGA